MNIEKLLHKSTERHPRAGGDPANKKSESLLLALFNLCRIPACAGMTTVQFLSYSLKL
jgi:hypothetical protein